MKAAPRIATLSVLVLLFGCIIEDRTEGPALRGEEVLEGDEDATDEADASPVTSEVSAACRSYCQDAIENCTDELAVYSGQEICEALCHHFPEGDPDEPEGNTLACRAHQARLAGTTGEPEVHCPNAGPGGNARGNNVGCGSDCEAYCHLHPLLCDIEGESPLEEEECLRQCAGLREKATFDVVGDHHDVDSLECRLQHLTSAAAAPVEHCWHAAMAPRPNSPCDDIAGSPVPCDVYCNLVMTACTGEFAMYESERQCLDVCEILPGGTAEDETGDTVACRRYHSYNALAAPAAHCLHAGPTGDGHCGSENCTAYCRIAEAACGDEFARAYSSDGTDGGASSSCVSECLELDGAGADESDYSLSPVSRGDTVGCRTVYAIRAIEDPAACGAALGGRPCE